MLTFRTKTAYQQPEWKLASKMLDADERLLVLHEAKCEIGFPRLTKY